MPCRRTPPQLAGTSGEQANLFCTTPSWGQSTLGSAYDATELMAARHQADTAGQETNRLTTASAPHATAWRESASPVLTAHQNSGAKGSAGRSPTAESAASGMIAARRHGPVQQQHSARSGRTAAAEGAGRDSAQPSILKQSLSSRVADSDTRAKSASKPVSDPSFGGRGSHVSFAEMPGDSEGCLVDTLVIEPQVKASDILSTQKQLFHATPAGTSVVSRQAQMSALQFLTALQLSRSSDADSPAANTGNTINTTSKTAELANQHHAQMQPQTAGMDRGALRPAALHRAKSGTAPGQQPTVMSTSVCELPVSQLEPADAEGIISQVTATELACPHRCARHSSSEGPSSPASAADSHRQNQSAPTPAKVALWHS